MSADFGKSTELWLVQQLRHRRARFTRRKHQLLGFCDRRRQEVKRMPRSIPAQLHGLDFQGTALTTHAARCAAVQKQPHVRHERHNGSMTWESFELATEIKSHWVACADLELCQTSLFFSTEKITTLDPETKVHTVPSNPYGYFWQVQKACDRLSCVCTFKHWQNGGRPKAQVTPHMLSEKILWDIESERLNLTLDKIVLVQPFMKRIDKHWKRGKFSRCLLCLSEFEIQTRKYTLLSHQILLAISDRCKKHVTGFPVFAPSNLGKMVEDRKRKTFRICQARKYCGTLKVKGWIDSGQNCAGPALYEKNW